MVITMDLKKYFLPEYSIYLENINYENHPLPASVPSLNCKDTIVAHLTLPAGVRITFNRTLSFTPESMFYLSVSFGVFLKFNPEKYSEIDWKNTDIAGEIKRSQNPLIRNLMSRASLLISEITSSSGQCPLITPAEPSRPPSKSYGDGQNPET